MDYLENYKQHQINHCELLLSSPIVNHKIYNLGIEDSKWQELFSKFYQYTFSQKNIKCYRYHNNYLYLDKDNYKNNLHVQEYLLETPVIKFDNFITRLTKRTESNQSSFSCQKKYDLIEEIKIIEVKINDEINVQFISSTQNTIKINIILNHNIDNNVIILKKILSLFN